MHPGAAPPDLARQRGREDASCPEMAARRENCPRGCPRTYVRTVGRADAPESRAWRYMTDGHLFITRLYPSFTPVWLRARLCGSSFGIGSGCSAVVPPGRSCAVLALS